MYSIVRSMIFFGFCSSIIVVRKKRGILKKGDYIISVLLSLLVLGLLDIFPIENLIYTFSSPEAVYSYMNGTNDVKLIVEGEACDMVIGGGDGEWKRTYVPKTEAGWKIDNSSINDQDIIFKIHKDISVNVLRYNGTDDYFVTASRIGAGAMEITDSRGQVFQKTEEALSENEGIWAVYYYAHVFQPDENYCVEIDGEKIYPLKEGSLFE